MPSVSAAPVVARVLEAELRGEPSLWSLTRHRACLVTHAANRSEQPNGDRRIDCDRELVASR